MALPIHDERRAARGAEAAQRRFSRSGGLAMPEMQLLLCFARSRLEPTRRARIRELLSGGIDWPRLLWLARRHKLGPLLAMHAQAFPEHVPSEVRQHLARCGLSNAKRLLKVTGELRELLAALNEAGIAAVPYKGPVLAAQVYGSLNLRQAGDIDLVVRRADARRAREVLRERGYRPRHGLGRGGEEFMVRSRYAQEFERDGSTPVELHWAFTSRDVGFPLELEQLAGRLETLAIGGFEVPAIAGEELVIILCVHGAKHRWDRFEWLSGLSEAVRGAPPLDWDVLVERATALGVRRMVLLGLLLAHDLLEAPVPIDVLALARRDGAVLRAAERVLVFLTAEAADDETDNLRTDLFRYGLRERLRDRVRFVAYRLTTPSQPERWTVITLGRRVIPVHGLLRPFRLLLRGIDTLRARLAGRT